MKLTTKGRYAVTAMLDLCINGADGPVPLCEIAKRQGISAAYLEQLFSPLKRGGLISSVRGASGGYCLTMAANAICVADVINAVEENIDATRCGGNENCQDSSRCLTHDLWQGLSETISHYLQSVTLAQLAESENTLAVAQRQRSGSVPLEFAELSVVAESSKHSEIQRPL